MTDLERGIIALLKASITQQAQALPTGFSLQEALPSVRRHQIAAICYDGAVRCGIDKQTPSMKTLFSGCGKSILQTHRQLDLCEQIEKMFCACKVDYMLLKGSALQPLYPAVGHRTMGDLDILIRPEQRQAACTAMEQLGFCAHTESDHELIFRRDGLIVELHKKLIPSYHKDYYALFENAWDFAIPTQKPHCYQMRDEDQLLYLLTHFAKHYRSGGIGCRNMTDLWLFEQKKPHLDKAYILSQFAKVHLDMFYQNVRKTLAVWFENAAGDSVTELLSDTVFQSGVYGTRKSNQLGEQLRLSCGGKQNVQKSYFLYSVFLPLHPMQRKYPLLQKAPFLLPLFWGVRIVRTLFSSRKTLREFEQTLKLSPQQAQSFARQLSAVGLEFDFS